MSSFTTPIDVYTIPDHTTTSSSPTSPVPTPSYLRSHSLQNFSTSKICVYSASSVASLTNLHPYNSSTFPLQFLSLVYSPSPQQQHIDASALGLYLQTREDRVKVGAYHTMVLLSDRAKRREDVTHNSTLLTNHATYFRARLSPRSSSEFTPLLRSLRNIPDKFSLLFIKVLLSLLCKIQRCQSLRFSLEHTFI